MGRRLKKFIFFQILEKYCGYGFLADREGNPILMSLLGNMDVEGIFFIFLPNII